jgi:hypothetical protein
MKGQDYRRETRLDMYECGKSAGLFIKAAETLLQTFN